MNRIKVRLKKSGFETELNENIARILIRKGEAELAEREVPRRGAKPAKEQKKPGRGRKTKKNDQESATEHDQEPEAEDTAENDEE